MAKEDLDTKTAAAKSEEERQLAHLQNLKSQLDADYKSRKGALDAALKSEQSAIDNYQKSQSSQLEEHYSRMKQQTDNDYKQRKTTLDTHLSTERTVIDNHYEQLTSKERLEAEARKMMIDGNQQEIVNLLNKYVPDWATAGQSAGQAFLNALQGVTPSIESEVSRIMGLINQASQAQNQLQNMIPIAPSEDFYPDYSSRNNTPQQQSYTVKSGDTLSGIARKYGVSVTSLRQENGLDPDDDRRLRIGTSLRIPILHEGGISLKEQFALIDKNEAVAPLAALARMMEDAVITTTNRMVAGFTQSIKNVSNVITTHNEPKIEIHVHYQGHGDSYGDMYNAGRILANETARELRSMGVPAFGG